MNDRILVPNGIQELTFIWMHGRGGSSEGFSGIFRSKPDKYNAPEVKFVFLQAPEMPVTSENGEKMTSWYVLNITLGMMFSRNQMNMETGERLTQST